MNGAAVKTKGVGDVFEKLAEVPDRLERLEQRIDRLLATMPRRMVKVSEAAEHYGVSRRTMWRLVRDGQVRVAKIGKLTRVDITDAPDVAKELRIEELARVGARRILARDKDKG